MRGLSFHIALIIEFRLDHVGAELFVMDLLTRILKGNARA